MLSLLKKVQTGFDSPPLYSIRGKLPGCEVPTQRICGTIHLRTHPTPYAFMGWTLVLLQPGRQLGCQNGVDTCVTVTRQAVGLPKWGGYLCYCNQAGSWVAQMGWTLVLLQPGRQLGCQNGAPAVFFRLRNDFSSSEFHRQVQFVSQKKVSVERQSVRKDSLNPRAECRSIIVRTDNGSRWWVTSNMQMGSLE
jgi:hypothetical protein